MAKSSVRIQAVRLRRLGMSIKDIAKRIGVSPGSISVWCRDVELSKIQQERLHQKQVRAGHKGRMIGAQVNKNKRLSAVKEEGDRAKKTVGRLSDRDRLMLGIGLYWGEGSKTRTSATAIVNSDPAIVRFSRCWFESLGVLPSEFRPYVSISESHRDRGGEIIRFWSKELGLPVSQFKNIIYLPRKNKKVYENRNLYYGIVSLRISRGTRLKYRILGLIEACKQLSA